MLFTHGEKSEAKNKAMICKEEYFHEVEDFVVSNDNRKPKSDDQPPKTEDIAPETEDHTPDCDDQIPDSDEKPLEKEGEDQTPDSDDQMPENDYQTTEKNRFYCNLCDTTYSDKSILKNHLLLTHTLTQWLPDNHPSISGASANSLMPMPYGMSSQKEIMPNNCVIPIENPFLCIICFKSFSEKIKLTLHINSVHNAAMNYERLQCIYCNVSFTEEKNLNTHVAEVHERKNLDAKIL